MTFLDVAPWPPEPTKRGLLDHLTPTMWLLIAATAALVVCLALAVAYRRRVAR